MSAEYKQDPERVKWLLGCFKNGGILLGTKGEPARCVTDYANFGALYTFKFSDGTFERLDASSPDDVFNILAEREWIPTERAAHKATAAALAKATRELEESTKDIAMWKDEAEAMGRAARRWAFYCAFAMLGGALLGYAARGVL